MSTINPQLQFSIFIKLLLVIFSTMVMASCSANVVVKPQLDTPSDLGTIVIQGSITYDGNLKYLPSTIEHKSNSDLKIAYEYVVSYDGTSGAVEFTRAMFNPLAIVGVPSGGDDVFVVGKLEFSRSGKILKQYTSEVSVTKPRSLFHGGTDKTELRTIALTSLKQNIELQMKTDIYLLKTLNLK